MNEILEKYGFSYDAEIFTWHRKHDTSDIYVTITEDITLGMFVEGKPVFRGIVYVCTSYMLDCVLGGFLGDVDEVTAK